MNSNNPTLNRLNSISVIQAFLTLSDWKSFVIGGAFLFAICFIILSSFLTNITEMAVITSIYIPVFIMLMACLVMFCYLLRAKIRGLNNIIYDNSAIELLFSQKIVKIPIESINNIRQHLRYGKTGLEYMDVYTLYTDKGNSTVDLRLFPGKQPFVHLLRNVVLQIEQQRLNDLIQQAKQEQSIATCEFHWFLGAFYYNEAGHTITFKNFFSTTTIYLHEVVSVGLEDRFLLNRGWTQYWVFRGKKHSQYIPDHIPGLSKQKDEIRKTIIRLCLTYGLRFQADRLSDKTIFNYNRP